MVMDKASKFGVEDVMSQMTMKSLALSWNLGLMFLFYFAQ